MNKLLLSLLGAALLPALTQCNTLEKDIAGINARNAEIAREPRGNYFVGLPCTGNALLGIPAPARPDLENGPTRHHG